jgi:hypothetical protein
MKTEILRGGPSEQAPANQGFCFQFCNVVLVADGVFCSSQLCNRRQMDLSGPSIDVKLKEKKERKIVHKMI